MNPRPVIRGNVNTKPQHSDGPWTLHETETRTSIRSADNRVVAYVQISAAQDDNATLIAAAPDLLALAYQYASECAECAGVGIKVDNTPCEDCNDIRDVIAKAVQS